MARSRTIRVGDIVQRLRLILVAFRQDVGDPGADFALGDPPRRCFQSGDHPELELLVVSQGQLVVAERVSQDGQRKLRRSAATVPIVEPIGTMSAKIESRIERHPVASDGHDGVVVAMAFVDGRGGVRHARSVARSVLCPQLLSRYRTRIILVDPPRPVDSRRDRAAEPWRRGSGWVPERCSRRRSAGHRKPRRYSFAKK